MQKNWWIQLLKGILFIVLGILAFYHPEEALLTLGTYIGYVSLFTGILYLYYSFTRKEGQHSSGWYLLEGLLDVVFGLLILSNPAFTIEVLPFLIGFWIIFLGITQLSGAFAVRKIFPTGKIWLFLLGIISVILGLMIVNQPLLSGIGFTTMLALFFIAYGTVQVFSSFKLKNIIL